MKKLLLILVLVVGLFGADSEEIGKPFIERGKGTVQSAVLDPNGEYFYTLKDETVTKWQLEPIKNVYSFKINLPKSKRYKMDISSEADKIVVWNTKLLSLIDLKTQKQIKTIDEEITWGVMDGLIFKTINVKKTYEYNRLISKTVYQERDLKKFENTKNIIMPYLCEDTFGCHVWHMFIYKNMIFASTPESSETGKIMAILDKTTLKELNENRKIRGNCYFTLDKQGLYCRLNREAYTKVNLNTLEEEKINLNPLEEKFSVLLLKKEFINEKILFSIHSDISLFKNLSLVFFSSNWNKEAPNLYFYNNEINKELATFHQFNNEWILISPEGYFEVSKNAKKHLKMKIKSGEVVPMNNATFEKYNKKINLKG